MTICDIIILVVLVAALAVGVKRGLLSGVAGILSAAAALFGASLAAEIFTPAVEQWLQPILLKKIENRLQGSQSADGGAMLGILGFDGSRLTEMLQSVTQRMKETGETLLRAVVDSAAQSMAYALVYLVSFVLLFVLCRYLTKVLDKMELPGLSQLNSIGGGLLGLLEGALLVFIAVWVLYRLNWLITADMVAQSTVLKFFIENSPVDLLAAL